MDEPTVWVFFYGSYMNFSVLKEVELVPGRWEVARLDGFDIRIAPRANLVPSDRDCVWGIVATATHSQLDRLYAHARDVLGQTYRPHPVMVEIRDGAMRPALCYICPEMAAAPAAADYVARIVAPARELEFPQWYIERLESFAPEGSHR